MHNKCNRKFKYRYLDKAPKGKSDLTALLKGGAIHSILEKYPSPSTHKIAPRYQHVVDNFVCTNLGAKYLNLESIREYNFGLTTDLEPTTYGDKLALFKGSIDYICTFDNILNLVDWKSGKFKDLRWQEFDQLMFYAIYFFKTYPKIDTIKISYVYVEHNESENDITLERKYLSNYIKQLMKLIENAENDVEFKKNPTKLCDWCDYKEHCANDK
jgi:CRISPR/Cas system-associated exonuclease Cas4 (RecB family)